MKRVMQYISIAFGFSWILWGLQYLGQEQILPEWFQLFGRFGLFWPIVAFMILSKLEGKSYKETFKQMFQKAPIWTILFAMISPMILSYVSYLFYLYFVSGTPEPIGVTWVSIIPTALMILFVGGPVEEFGWRGYLLPRLRGRFQPVITILLLGIIHGLWHLPLHFLDGTVQSALPIYEFLLITIAVTVSYVFIYEYTRSLIPMIVLHWFANLSSAIFPYYYNQAGRYAILIVTILLDIVLVLLITRKQHPFKQKEAE